MLALLKLFIEILLLILVLSAFCGIIAFFKDLHDFKSEKNLSLPRKRLIETLLLEEMDQEKDGENNNAI